ncbi:hypothetical protein BJ508DRAFT_361220 [Ascobolus immersus RN42]|uniref:Uncharacterized protein n=1 Tax=Ascobolus immersus RN42 TaxID=1160509 RepID=A0A3N4ILN4_ASCIM|nr:hypothetical protein BJ508DRAFT_361220 [Ascobolus immersus RN42]
MNTDHPQVVKKGGKVWVYGKKPKVFVVISTISGILSASMVFGLLSAATLVARDPRMAERLTKSITNLACERTENIGASIIKAHPSIRLTDLVDFVVCLQKVATGSKEGGPQSCRTLTLDEIAFLMKNFNVPLLSEAAFTDPSALFYTATDHSDIRDSQNIGSSADMDGSGLVNLDASAPVSVVGSGNARSLSLVGSTGVEMVGARSVRSVSLVGSVGDDMVE